MSAKRVELSIVGRDSDGRPASVTPAEKMGAVLEAFSTTFKSLTEEQCATLVQGLLKLYGPLIQPLLAATFASASARSQGAKFTLQTPVRGEHGEIVNMIVEEYSSHAALKAREAELGIEWTVNGKVIQ